jgi:plastocyanin
MDETLFYVCGITLVIVALVVSFLGLRERSFPAGPVFGAAIAAFALLVLATTTFAVRYSEDEQAHREAEEAAEAAEAQEAQEAPAADGGGEGAAAPEVKGPGGTLALAADPAEILFDKNQLTSKPGEVTIEFTNPSTLEHDVAILQGDQQIAKSALIADGETSVSAELAPGAYTFLCTVPGHAESGMEGTLTVK